LQQALQVTDAAIERQDVHGNKTWSDYEQQYTVILTIRADALYELGRWQAAVAQLEAASRLKSADVGNIIDLAKLYNTLGRSREARETLQRDSAEDTSQFGHMQFEKQALWAAVELHEPSKAERALAYLREHRGDAPSAYQEALLIAHRPNAGAALLISRLADPKQRRAALLAVQYYTENAASPQMVELQRRWRALLARHDVQQAITRVGRADHYPLLRDNY
jgi:tetratricopeptide (TPR) repeat protein